MTEPNEFARQLLAHDPAVPDFEVAEEESPAEDEEERFDAG